jgi:hypothetical protein
MPAPETGSKPVDFNRDILPILSDNCFACHGPDERQRMANLRLDEKESIFADRGGYWAVVPGKSAESKLYQKISSADAALRMPPVFANRTLTPAQIDLIRRWIDEGAPYSKHWAFVAPKRPPVPEVKDTAWPRNAIDNFVLFRLESEGLKPSPPADRATLLRRVTFDLTGLPPTPAEVDSFLADKSPDAYEKRVDQLLASPHYGEHMARAWLDLARYADTNGYDTDGLRKMWPWRDWVIKAYNQNMPYDQFTIKQLAGDLLPNASLEDKIATGFNRNHMIDDKGEDDPQEYHVEYVVDRVNTAGTAFLGLTVGCARCHDHKYDPIKQKDFYALFAFFNSVPEPGIISPFYHGGNAAPVVSLPSPEQAKMLGSLDNRIAATLARIPEKEMMAQEEQWRPTGLATMPAPSTQGLTAYYEFENTLGDSSGHGLDAKVVRDDVLYVDGAVGKAAEFSGETQIDFGQAGDFDRDKPFALAFWVSRFDRFADLGTQEGLELFEKRDGSAHWKGYEISLDDPHPLHSDNKPSFRVHVRLANSWPEDAMEVKSKNLAPRRFQSSAMQHLVVNYDGSGKASGIKVYLDGVPLEMEAVRDHLTGSFRTSAPLAVGNKNIGRPFLGQMDDLRIYSRTLTAGEVENLAIQSPARTLLAELAGKPVPAIASLRPEKPPAEAEIGMLDEAMSKEQEEAAQLKDHQARLSEYFLTFVAPEKCRKAYAHLNELRAEKVKLKKSITTTMVMAEMKRPRETFVLGRGQFDNPKQKAAPGVPAFLLPLPKDAPLNRLTLAKWLVDPGNPLTARVEVNRYWQAFFGRGMVKTAEDFGSQGDPPSHPELLDWLATEFIRSGWNVKAMQRLIVTSATYQQSSRITPELAERDPENRLLARGPRVRLTAEEIRDNALAISGLLNTKIGGPSVYPYQPKGLWEESSGFGAKGYVQGTGQDLYRRSLYTIWKRSVLSPTLATFDASDRQRCTARRNLSNTPLQALVLLNDPTYVEASRALAQRAILEGGPDAGRRVDFAFRWATDRNPDVKARAVLLQLEQETLSRYREDPASALKLIRVGEKKPDPKIDPAELAAWTTVARVILNMDETITKQ